MLDHWGVFLGRGQCKTLFNVLSRDSSSGQSNGRSPTELNPTDIANSLLESTLGCLGYFSLSVVQCNPWTLFVGKHSATL